tara:strand:+ start:13141 stop:16284 length:3144 start_codon:yes stop_codon:yes gene_type:complete
MSYISISTNQPSEGQRQLTEREPANLRNDFKVPIEIKSGDTIELVSLKFNVGAIVIDENNNRIVWSVGEAPFATYHAALIPYGSYDSPSHLAIAIADAFNACTLLPSYQENTLVNPYQFTKIPGWTCEWVTTAAIGKFVITANQSESPGLKTNGSIANAIYTGTTGTPAFKRLIADGFAVNNQLNFVSELPAGGYLPVIGRAQTINDNGTEKQLDAQVFAQKRWSSTSAEADVLALTMFTLATDETGGAAVDEGLIGEDIDSPEIWYDSESNQLGNNGGHSFETSRISSSLIVESQLSVDLQGNTSKFVEDMGGIYNNGGRIRCEVKPIMGYNLNDFIGSTEGLAHLVGQTLTVELQRYDRDGNDSVITRDMLVAAPAAATNGWDLSLTVAAGQEFDPTGVDGAPETFTTLWMAYMPGLTDPTYGPLATYHDGMWAMGFNTAGGAPAPPDANNPINHNAFRDPTNFKARNYWYYDLDVGHFRSAYRELCVPEVLTGFDEYTRPVRTRFIFNGITRDTPVMFNPATVNMEIKGTQHLGWPACKVGLNRRARVTTDFLSQNNNEFAGYKSFVDSTVGNKIDEACEYSISINNGDPGIGQISVDATTGVRVPIVNIRCPKPFTRVNQLDPKTIDSQLPVFGDKGWLESDITFSGRLNDTGAGDVGITLVPAESLYLEIELNKNNEITCTIASQAGSGVITPNPFPVELPAYTAPFSVVIKPDTTDNDTGCRLMESDFPLTPLIQVGGGGYSGISLGGLHPKEAQLIGAAYTIDMSGPYRKPHSGETQSNPRLSFQDAYPQTAIAQTFTLDTDGRINDTRNTVASNSSDARDSVVPRIVPVDQNRENLTFYNKSAAGAVIPQPEIFGENAVAIESLRANTYSNTGLSGMGQNIQIPASADKTSLESVNKISFNGIEEGLSVNLLNGNIKGFNGGTADINKAVAYLQPEQLITTTSGLGSRTFFHQSQTSRPVDVNVPETQYEQSLTVQLRNSDNELVRGIEAPVEIVLYKRSKDTTVQEIRSIINSFKSDKQENKIQTAGVGNPLLGVIPR